MSVCDCAALARIAATSFVSTYTNSVPFQLLSESVLLVSVAFLVAWNLVVFTG